MKMLVAGAALAAIAAISMSADASKLSPEQEARIKPVGKALDCVQLRSIRETRVRDDRTIDFYMAGNKVYRNTLPYSCSELGAEERFSYSTSLSELCSVDMITVLHGPPSPAGATCGLGKFQPITGAPK